MARSPWLVLRSLAIAAPLVAVTMPFSVRRAAGARGTLVPSWLTRASMYARAAEITHARDESVQDELGSAPTVGSTTTPPSTVQTMTTDSAASLLTAHLPSSRRSRANANAHPPRSGGRRNSL